MECTCSISGMRQDVIDERSDPRLESRPQPTARTIGGTTTRGIDPDPEADSRSVWIRRAFLTLLAVVVVMALFGFLGVRSRTVRQSSPDGAVALGVHYAAVARAGLAVPFTITVHQPGGFHGDVRLAVSGKYLELFDRNAIDPEPSSATSTGDDVVWTFDQPPGDTLEVSLDLQVQGGQHWGRSGTVGVIDQTGRPV